MRTKTVYRLAAFAVVLALAFACVGCAKEQPEAVVLYDTETVCIERQGADTRIYARVGDSVYTLTAHRTRIKTDAAQDVKEASTTTNTDTITIQTVLGIIIVTDKASGKTLYIKTGH